MNMNEKIKTNADSIRAMTDEELAEFLAKNYISCARCFFRRTSSKDPIGVCLECCLGRLRAPVEESHE